MTPDKFAKRHAELYGEIERLHAERAELVAALRSCEAVVSEGSAPPDWDWIREVIAKAENPHPQRKGEHR